MRLRLWKQVKGKETIILFPRKQRLMMVSRFFIFGLSPIDYSKDFTKAFFLGLPNPQNGFVFCFKVDLDLAEIQNHALLKNASKNGITETI